MLLKYGLINYFLGEKLYPDAIQREAPTTQGLFKNSTEWAPLITDFPPTTSTIL